MTAWAWYLNQDRWQMLKKCSSYHTDLQTENHSFSVCIIVFFPFLLMHHDSQYSQWELQECFVSTLHTPPECSLPSSLSQGLSPIRKLGSLNQVSSSVAFDYLWIPYYVQLQNTCVWNSSFLTDSFNCLQWKASGRQCHNKLLSLIQQPYIHGSVWLSSFSRQNSAFFGQR